jgi:hypothetical protein
MSKSELQKCKEDIVYFAENYLEPKLQLTEWEKEIMRSFQKGEVLAIETRGRKRFLTTITKEHFQIK